MSEEISAMQQDTRVTIQESAREQEKVRALHDVLSNWSLFPSSFLRKEREGWVVDWEFGVGGTLILES